MGRPRSFDADVVLDQVAEVFRASGFDGASVEDLEKATGLRRASLYGAYGDKRALYLASLRRYERVRAMRLAETLNAARNGRAAVERLFAVVIDEADGDRCGCLLVNAASERLASEVGVARCVADNRRRVEGFLLAGVLRGRADGSVRARGDARGVARFLFAVTLGIRVLAQTSCDRADLADVSERALRALR